MIEMMILPFIICWKKLKTIFQHKDTYFILLSIVFMLFVFITKPTDMTYVKLFTTFAFMPFIYLIWKYILAKESIFGVVLAWAGSYLNSVCIKLNGLMPVIPIWQRSMIEKTNTVTHFITTYSECRLWIFADIFDLYYEIYSIGDLMIFAFFFLVIMGYFKKIVNDYDYA